MIMKLGNVNIDKGSNVLAKNCDSPRCNEGVIFLSNNLYRRYAVPKIFDFLPNMLAPPSEVEVSHEKYTHKI